MWTTGKIGEYGYQIKHFEDYSIYGINEGRISKLRITRNGQQVLNYDRGWDVERYTPAAQDQETLDFYQAILDKYN